MELESDDSDTNSEKSEKIHVSSSHSNVFNNKSSTPETSNDKEYTELKPVTDISPSTSIPYKCSSKPHSPHGCDTPSPPPVNLEMQSDSSYPPSSDPSRSQYLFQYSQSKRITYISLRQQYFFKPYTLPQFFWVLLSCLSS